MPDGYLTGSGVTVTGAVRTDDVRIQLAESSSLVTKHASTLGTSTSLFSGELRYGGARARPTLQVPAAPFALSLG